MKLINRIAIFLIIFAITPAFQSCESVSDSLGDINLFSIEEDVRMGKQLNQEIHANPQEYPMLDNQEVDQYLENMLADILQSSDVKYAEDFEYNIQVIDKEVVNAFAAPGGYLYFYTGLLKFCENEATLAGIIAHEVAHCEERHATKRMTKQYGASVLLGAILGDDPAVYEEIAANLLTGLAFLKNSRSDEYEADEHSFEYLKATTWYPGGIKYFFDKADENREAGFLEELLSTHPLPQNRMDEIENMINNSDIKPATEDNIFTQRYQEFLSTLP